MALPFKPLNKILPLPFFTIVFFVIACSQPQKVDRAGVNDELEIIHLNQETFDQLEPLKMSTLIDSFYYVALETTRESLFSSINEINVGDSAIFIMDQYGSKSVFMFKHDGTFLRKIGKPGKGPGEYTLLQDFEVDHEKQEIFIYDPPRHSIHKYDFSGTYLGSISVKDIFFTGFSLAEDRFVLYADFYHNLNLGANINKTVYIVDRESGNIISTGSDKISAYGEIAVYNGSNSIVRNQNTISYSPIYSDTIYVYNQNSDRIISKYHIDFHEMKIDREHLKGLPHNEFFDEVYKGPETALFTGNHHQTSKYLYFHFESTAKKYLYHVYYHKKSKRTTMFYEYVQDSLAYLGAPLPMGTSKDFFVTALDPIATARKKDLIKDNPDLFEGYANRSEIKIIQEASETSNPILFFFRLK